MSKENVADYTPIPAFETAEANGKDLNEEETQDPPSRRFRKTYFTKRDCIIVAIVVGLALAAIAVSLVYGLPALEAKRMALMNGTTTEESVANVTGVLLEPTPQSS